jgi:hypothetical protein
MIGFTAIQRGSAHSMPRNAWPAEFADCAARL